MRVRAGAVGLALALTAGAAASVAVLRQPQAAGRSSAAPVVAAVPTARELVASRSRVAPAVVKVAPLRVLRTPDLLVTLRRPLTPAQLRALHAVRGMQGVTVLDVGTVRVDGKGLRIAGVDPSQFRQFTPRETATSDPLWASVARGELAPTYGVVRERKLGLGATLPVQGLAQVPARIGAVAVFGVPGVDVVTAHSTARRLGVVAGSAILLNAPDRGIWSLTSAVRGVVGAGAQVDVLRPKVVTPSSSRPKTYRDLYIASARYCPGLRWQVLAAIGQVESGHGRNVGPSSAGALGPMQFLPSTWAYAGVDGDGDGKADIMNPYDAVPSAALYLCRAGAANGPQGLYDAIFSYNHADWYVKMVLDLAARYR